MLEDTDDTVFPVVGSMVSRHAVEELARKPQTWSAALVLIFFLTSCRDLDRTAEYLKLSGI